ncbi:MAG: potassium-transporting ATPase subunit KdpA [Anaerolineae bacterium]|nr:potassium-transporting ATPase subunit KdpA [Anaerolineae bacterium]
MTVSDLLQIAVYLGVLTLATPFLGHYMYQVFTGARHLLSPLRPVEQIVYRLGGIDSQTEMRWTAYAWAVLAFNAAGLVFLFVLQLLQGLLPLNPTGLAGVEPFLAFNTAVSFVTNTNWQAYGGEVTLTYFTQMIGLTVQNFVSAGTGIAVLLALTRGLAARSGETLGNFWVDLTRAVIYVLLPLSILWTVAMIGQGVVQNFNDYTTVATLSGETQLIPQGPAASQIAIKQLGTNGGGFFNVNSSHPYENPTPISNFLQMLAILLIPAALTYTYGKMIGSLRQGWVIFAAMMILFVGGLTIMLWAEYSTNPILMEGKEARFGVINSVLWAQATTSASNGSVNAMHSSLSPLAGGVAMLNMLLGEIIFGGVGSGLYGMLIFVILTVFIAGLMVGRTPEYLGKKIESREIQMAIVAVLLPNASVLLLTALAIATETGLASRANPAAHGFSEILYAFASASNNNGSAFAGLNANTPFYNTLLGFAMLIGRFGVIFPVLAIAGSLLPKRVAPPSSGTFPTDRPLFIGLLIAVILIIGALTYFPALTLGPIVQQLLLMGGA